LTFGPSWAIIDQSAIDGPVGPRSPNETITMATPIIAQKSPYVLDAKPGTYWWCTCGGSKAQPFCDGSHKGTGFAPKKVEITTVGMVGWCGCKHSQNGAFCDGSNKRV
jgi:CDGSH-type Zn-finger protein